MKELYYTFEDFIRFLERVNAKDRFIQCFEDCKWQKKSIQEYFQYHYRSDLGYDLIASAFNWNDQYVFWERIDQAWRTKAYMLTNRSATEGN